MALWLMMRRDNPSVVVRYCRCPSLMRAGTETRPYDVGLPQLRIAAINRHLPPVPSASL